MVHGLGPGTPHIDVKVIGRRGFVLAATKFSGAHVLTTTFGWSSRVLNSRKRLYSRAESPVQGRAPPGRYQICR
jgi:hypothetical protein